MEDNIAKEPIAAYAGKHYTYTDYLKFGYDEAVEIIKGKIFKMSPAPSSLHQIISRNISGLLYNRLKGQKCQFFSAPFDVILPVEGKDFEQSDRVIQPDVCVICDPEKIRKRGCFGAPDWIIEILSPHTAKKDLQDKFSLYEESGVNEYWIVEPKNSTVEVFVLKNGKYARINTYVQDDIIPCQTLEGMTIDMTEVFE
ncbi:MAG: Uma2 family endonuclease [Halioglobus sp.]|jgi:Uma2 family endonuclease